jgi:type II secretory pathway predicted ATPase ExeA
LVTVPYASQQAAFRFLHDTHGHDRGLGLFHGPPLSGKTTILQHFTSSLPDDYAVAVTNASGATIAHILQDVLGQFGYGAGFNSARERFNMIKVFARQQAGKDRAPLLVIENAHTMSPVLFELLNEFAELRIRHKSAIRVVLASDRPLSPLIEATGLRSIAARVTGKFLLRPLTAMETTGYLHQKLKGGGCRAPADVLPVPVCSRLHEASGGWPGMIDRMAVRTIAQAKRCPVRVEDVPPPEKTGSLPEGRPAKLHPVPTARPVESKSSAPQLIVTRRGQTLRRITLDKPRLTIGRNPLCDVHADDNGVSRHHAILVRNDNATIIIDLKSRNGTRVNDQRVNSQVLINDDVISIGEYRLKVIDPGARRRVTLRGAGWDESTIAKSVKKLRAVVARHTGGRSAG